jgi:hypothetical protein
MDEGRKLVLWICAAVLAGPKLTELDDGKNDSAQAHMRFMYCIELRDAMTL